MSTYYIEIRNTVKRSGSPRLVLLEDAHRFTGFRSVFAYTKEVADLIKETGGTSFMRGTPVYSDVLLMDFDDCEPTEFLQYLQDENIGYELYHSGNRSKHISVDIEPMFGQHVPRSQKAWVKRHAPTADSSFYHVAGLFRLNRTFHEKNPGNKKTLIEKRAGNQLVIPEADATHHKSIVTGEVRTEDFISLLTTKTSVGNRRPMCWLLGATAADLGLPIEEAINHIQWWNLNFASPSHDLNTIIKQCEAAYERQGRLHER